MLASTVFGWQTQYFVMGVLIVVRMMMPVLKWFRKL